jgi:hypothetical protein
MSDFHIITGGSFFIILISEFMVTMLLGSDFRQRDSSVYALGLEF